MSESLTDKLVCLFVLCWALQEAEHSQPRCSYLCAAAAADLSLAYVASSEGVVRHLELPSMVVKGEIALDAGLNCQVSSTVF